MSDDLGQPARIATWPAAARRWGLPVVAAALCALAWRDYVAHAEPPRNSASPQAASPSAHNSALKLPEGWPAGHPLPTVESNCMKCHLHAGRELTLAVKTFGRSVHDLNGFTCHDCHGGNADDDASAHEDEFGFIGTKLSAHLAKCGSCHEDQQAALAVGPHYWNFSKRINTKYPMCVDCHGNHDVGNPPETFSLKTICLDCHEKMDEEWPAYAAVIDQNDRFWNTLGAVKRQNVALEDPIPDEFHEAIDQLRDQTMRIVHGVGPLEPAAASDLNRRSEQLRAKLAEWLTKAQQASAAR